MSFSKKTDALWVQKSRILVQVGDRVADSGGFDPCLLLKRTDWCSEGREEGL